MICAFLFATLLSAVFSGYQDSGEKEAGEFSFFYRDLPGLTGEEAAAIEALKGKTDFFIYATIPGTEAYLDNDGEIRGFTALFCEWLYEFFGIPFMPKLYARADLLEGLKTGEIDFTGGQPPTEEDYSPLIFRPASFSTQNPELLPIVSVMEKALENGAGLQLIELYNRGYQEYMRHKLFMRLSEEERTYINANPVIPVAAEYDNYPVSFFNSRENGWQGIAHDALRKVESLTGLKFKIINDRSAEWPELYSLLESGEALMLTELYRTPDRIARFLWPKSLFYMDHTALISKADHPSINMNEVLSARVGLSKGTAHTELFWRWFPDHNKAKEYESKAAVLEALVRDEIDMAMTYLSSLLYLTHYREVTGFKANLVFNHGLESAFGINKDAVLLCSIIDKALDLIELETISGQWLHMPYDYRFRLIEAKIPWMTGVAGLIMVILIILIILQTINNRKREVVAARRAIASSYEYAKKLGGALTKITRSPTISAGVLKDAADMIAREGCRALKAARVGVRSMTREGGALKSLSCYDLSAGEYIDQKDFDLSSSGEFAKLFETERLIVTNNIGISDVWFGLAEDYGPYLCARLDVPIRIDGQLAGAVGIEQDRCQEFSKQREWTMEEQNFASSLADLMALAISSAERRQAREAAELANRTKSEFLATVSHEIRTPMNSIMGFAELALESDALPQIKDYLGKITGGTEWLLRIINDILDLSKMESGKMALENKPFDLNEVISRCQAGIMPGVKEKGLDLKVNLAPPTGQKLLGDPFRLYQALMNLLSNAVKFTSAGTISFSSAAQKSGRGLAAVYFEIKDTGLGMDAGQIQKVFDPFVQADTGAKRNFGGLGLGLPIAKNIVDLMGGKLKVESSPGAGSAFSFEIVFEAMEADLEADSGLLEKPSFDALILVCDDNSMNQEVIREHLSRVGIRVETAENGQEGIERVEARLKSGERLFDLIFMDMFMPVMDGMEAASKILALNTGIPIVAMTANAMADDLEKYKENGMPDCLGKPFTSQELWRILRKYLK